MSEPEMDEKFERLVEDVAGLLYPPFRGWQEWERMREERIAALWRWHREQVEKAVREALADAGALVADGEKWREMSKFMEGGRDVDL